MNYELYFFQQLISSINQNQYNKEDNVDTEEEISQECIRIRQRIDIFSPTPAASLRSYLHYQLNCMERACLQIEQLQIGETAPEKKNILSLVGNAIESLIFHIHHFFPTDFNLATRATSSFVQAYLEQNSAQINSCLSLLTQKAISPVIIQAVQHILIPSKATPPSFFHLQFAKELLDPLEHILEQPHPEKQLSILLISRQYNHPDLYLYLISQLNHRQHHASTIAEQYQTLILYRKELAQIMETGDRPYFPDQPNLKTSLLQAITAEIDFMKELDFLNSELVNSGLLDSTYKVSLSVRQLAFYIFLNMECGVITEKKARSVHHYITTHVSTKETEQISEKSFSNGYYVHHPEDIRKVSEVLAKMLALAQKLY